MARLINPDEIMDGSHQQASRLARHSRFDCIVWIRRDGQSRYARLTAATIKQAMLDSGTQSVIVCYPSYGKDWPQIFDWWIANNVRRRLVREGR